LREVARRAERELDLLAGLLRERGADVLEREREVRCRRDLDRRVRPGVLLAAAGKDNENDQGFQHRWLLLYLDLGDLDVDSATAVAKHDPEPGAAGSGRV